MLEALPDFGHSVRTSVFELDVRRDIVLLALEEMKDLLDRSVAFSPRRVLAVVLLAVFDMQVADPVVVLLDVGDWVDANVGHRLDGRVEWQRAEAVRLDADPHAVDSRIDRSECQ